MLRNTSILILVIVTTLLSGLQGQDWKQFPYTPPGSLVSFPVDEGRHAEEPVEWWYISGQVTGSETGISYSFMLSYFYYPALGFDGFRILNLCRDDTGEFYSDAQGLFYTELGTEDLDIRATLMNDTLEWWRNLRDTSENLVPFEYELSASSLNGSIQLFTESIKDPLILGDSGMFNQGISSYTYYYSLTRNKVSGTIIFGDTAEEVSGYAWIDKQYGNFLSETREVYEWLSVNLSNGMDFVLWDLFTEHMQIPDTSTYRHMSIHKDSTSQITIHDFQLERLGYAWMPDNALCYARKWRLQYPAMEMDLLITTLNSHPDVTLPFRFYEGATTVSGTVNGVEVTGTGFAELMKNYVAPEPALMYPPNGGGTWKDSIRIGWALLNPDDGRNTLYDLEYTTDGGSSYTLLQQGITETTYHWKDTDHLKYNDSCIFRVRAYTPDQVLTGSVKSQNAFVFQPDTVSTFNQGLSASPHAFSLYPVPAKDFLIIETVDDQIPFFYQIYDELGLLVLRGEICDPESLTKVSLDHLSPGTYIIKITPENSLPQSIPFLKMQ